jgi:hypothetical protein
MTQFNDISVGAFFTLFPNADSTLCVKVSRDSSSQGYGCYRYATDAESPDAPYLIAHDCTVTPRSDTVIIRRDHETGALVAFMPVTRA